MSKRNDPGIIPKPKAQPLYKPVTVNQEKYVTSIGKNIITFGIGPAGTGKTLLATVEACKSLKAGECSRIILLRPIVEAGEKIGFLPGNIQEKVDPYMAPLYDAMEKVLPSVVLDRYLEKNIIEVNAIAFARGRTFEDAFVIIDEAQNTTKAQMKMILTRIGEKSKMVVTGDLTQIDLPPSQSSGLQYATERLENVDDIGIVYFDLTDIRRSDIVSKILERWGKNV